MTTSKPRTMLFGVAFAMLAGGLTPQAHADERPALITYGKDAPTREGDFYHEQAIYVSVPEESTERLWINVFDPGISAQFDQPPRLRGGEPHPLRGVRRRRAPFRFPRSSRPALRPKRQEPERSSPRRSLATSRMRSGSGRRLPLSIRARAKLSAAAGSSACWCRASEGNAGNVFDVAVSARETRHKKPEGLEIFTYRPVVRVPDSASFAELRFRLPEGADRLTVHGFDLAYGTLHLTTAFSSTAARSAPARTNGGRPRYRSTQACVGRTRLSISAAAWRRRTMPPS